MQWIPSFLGENVEFYIDDRLQKHILHIFIWFFYDFLDRYHENSVRTVM